MRATLQMRIRCIQLRRVNFRFISFDSFFEVVQDLNPTYEQPKMNLKLKPQEQVHDEFMEIWLHIFMTNYFKFAERVHRPNQIYGKS